MIQKPDMRFKVEQEEKSRPKDLRFLSTLIKLLEQISDGRGSLDTFATVASSIDYSWGTWSEGSIQVRIKALIEQEESSIAAGIGDYGTWRQTYNNATFEQFAMATVLAKNGTSLR